MKGWGNAVTKKLYSFHPLRGWGLYPHGVLPFSCLLAVAASASLTDFTLQTSFINPVLLGEDNIKAYVNHLKNKKL
jgi:hypothetical protein